MSTLFKYTAVGSLCVSALLSQTAYAASATFDAASGLVEMPIVELREGTSSQFFSATLRLVEGNQLELVSATPIASGQGQQRNVMFLDNGVVHVNAVEALGAEWYARLRLIPGTNPMRLQLEDLSNNNFEGCPSFAAQGPIDGTCVLSGELRGDMTLTKNTEWILSGSVFVGGDNTEQSTIRINPGVTVIGQQGTDYLLVRRGSKIIAEGTPDSPIVMQGANGQGPGEWGGLELHGNAPVNGCNEGVAVCELPNVIDANEFFGGNDPMDDSGVIRFMQVLNTGFAVLPDQELNCLTFNGVGAGTLVEFVHCHDGADDGFEMFGGTVNIKHVIATNIDDDSLDWQFGWQGNAQFMLVKQADTFGDNGIEGDNQAVTEALPRSTPTISNMTVLGSPSARDRSGVLLRVGTGGRIWNSVFTDFPFCITIDDASTFQNAGAIGNLSGLLTMNNSFVDCPTNFREGDDPTFTVADWFFSQQGNQSANPQLNGFLPAASSPLLNVGITRAQETSIPPVQFFEAVDYAGAFRDENDDWTAEWSFPIDR
ncbi:MAG: hypothetical protein RQ715_01275 [Methylococcales bacterium]|nr:hypothetical protein [Methylococcales bacterium]